MKVVWITAALLAIAVGGAEPGHAAYRYDAPPLPRGQVWPPPHPDRPPECPFPDFGKIIKCKPGELECFAERRRQFFALIEEGCPLGEQPDTTGPGEIRRLAE